MHIKIQPAIYKAIRSIPCIIYLLGTYTEVWIFMVILWILQNNIKK